MAQRAGDSLAEDPPSAPDVTAASASSAPRGGIRKVPILLLSGFLGAGKTTMLKHLLENKAGLKIGAVVNDVAAVNIDAKLTRGVLSTDGGDGVVQLQNGCACCSASEELFVSIEQLVRLALRKRSRYDYIVIEGSGVAEPKMIRERFQLAEEDGMPILRLVFLSTMVTVVDAAAFPKLFETRDAVEDRPELGVDEYDDGGAERRISDLLTEQVECADILVLNKTDLIAPSAVQSLRQVLAALNMSAEVRCCEWGKVPLDLVLRGAEQGACDADGDGVLLTAERDAEDDHRRMVMSALAQQAKHGHDHGRDHDDEHGHEHGHKHGHEHDDEHGHEHGHEHGDDHGHDHGHEHGHGHGHEHKHAHEHEHDHKHEHGHNHEHEHAHDHEHSHDHGHDHGHQPADTTRAQSHFGIRTFVYQRRRPFHPERLSQRAIELLPVETNDAISKGIALQISSEGATSVSSKAESQAAVGQSQAEDEDDAPEWTQPPQDGSISALQPGEAGSGAVAAKESVDESVLAANKQQLSTLVRSKGFVWLASYHTDSLYWSHAGTHFQLASQGQWWAATDAELWPKEEEHLKTVLGDCAGEWGDRRQELVMIGVGMDVTKMTALLDECLLTDSEMSEYSAHWKEQGADPVTPWSESHQ